AIDFWVPDTAMHSARAELGGASPSSGKVYVMGGQIAGGSILASLEEGAPPGYPVPTATPTSTSTQTATPTRTHTPTNTPTPIPPNTVVNLQDNGSLGSLRQVIGAANAGATITFSSGLTGTITLSSELAINKNLTINGPGQSAITISGNGTTRVLNVGAGSTVTIRDLTIAEGYVLGDGGGILNAGTLTLERVPLSSNRAQGGSAGGGRGGAIFNSASVTIRNSPLDHNFTIISNLPNTHV